MAIAQNSEPPNRHKELFPRLRAGELEFGFSLCFKPLQLGKSHVMQFWMDSSTLYGQRGKHATNLQPMADYFWHSAVLRGTAGDPDVQESYLLAHLCPYVRGSGSQKVLVDARLWPTGTPAAVKYREAEELEKVLSSLQRQPVAAHRQMTMLEFYRKSAGILGMPDWTDAQCDAYRELSEILLGPARALLNRDHSPTACNVAIAAWQLMMRTIGRRGGPKLASFKTAMNMLSYEARAAVHRCYSNAWINLIPQLINRLKPSAETAPFLQLMHTERVSASETAAMDFHLFHGHLFALHPGMSSLMRTPTGQGLLGDYLQASTAEEQVQPFQRLLMGIYVSLYHYTRQREDQQRRRSTREADAGEDGVEGIIERNVSRRSGKRRVRKQPED